MNEKDYFNFNLMSMYDKRMKKAIKKAKKRGKISAAEAKEWEQMNFADLTSIMALMLGEVDVVRDLQKFGTVQVPEEQLDALKRTIENQKKPAEWLFVLLFAFGDVFGNVDKKLPVQMVKLVLNATGKQTFHL